MTELFRIGDRVEMTDEARAMGLDGRADPGSPVLGTVVGFGRGIGKVRVKLDRLRTVETWSGTFWRVVSTQAGTNLNE